MRFPWLTPSGTRRSRTWRGLLRAVAGLALAYAALLIALAREPVRAELRDRIRVALRARLGEVTLGDTVRIDPLLRIAFGPLSIGGGHPGDPPVIRIERVKVRPRLLPLLAGRAEPASIRLLGVRVETGPGGRALEELWARLRRRPARRPAPAPERTGGEEGEGALPTLVVRDLVVAVPLAGEAVELGPLQAGLSGGRERGADRWELQLGLPGGGRGSLDLRRDAAGWHAEARLAGLGPEALPAGLRPGPARIERGQLSIELFGDASPDLTRAQGRVRIQTGGLEISGERISGQPLGPLDAVLESRMTWEAESRRLALREGRLVLLGALPLALSGEARLGPGLPFSLSLEVEDASYPRLVAALPAALAPPPDAPHPEGSFDAQLALAGPLLAPGAWAVEARLGLARLREAARRAPPVALREPFVYRPEVERGPAPEILVGPANPGFVPLAELPTHVIRAVTAAEDAGFFAHDGFDFEEIRNALAQGTQAGRVVRGGSTITQQLAKNLYLSREKTLARKITEAAVTVALEATVPKQRLLEIYLNVAEWGPGVWGIGPAARHWFGKDARALTPREAAFLASVIPNPVRYHVMWEQGATTEAWDQRVDELLLKLEEQGVLSDDQLVAAMREPLAFARPQVAGP